MLTPEQIKAIKERADRATPGEWYATSPSRRKLHTDANFHRACDEVVAGIPPRGMLVCTRHTGGIRPLFDQQFIAAARADVPALCETVDAIRAENERLRAVVEAAFTHDHIVLIGEDGPCNICVALAALDQERKEGE